MGTNTQQKTQVHTQSSNVGTSLAAHPEDTQVAVIVKLNQLALVDGSDTELTLDGRNQRRALEQGASKGLEGTSELSLATRQLVVKADDGNILLSGSLLRLDQSSRSVDTDDQAARDLGIEGTTVTSLLNSAPISLLALRYSVRRAIGIPIDEETASRHEPKNSLNPGHNLVTRRVRRLVQVDDTRADVGFEITLQGRRSIGNGGEVASSHKD